MKKLLGMVAGLAILIGLGNVSQANCLDIRFDNGESICVSLDKSGNRYYASVESASSSPSLRNVSLGCEILLPNDVLEPLGACDGDFSYASTRTENVRLHVRYDNRYYEVVDASYNFNNGTWTSGGGGGSYYNTLNISANRTSPSTDQWVNVTVNTESSYRGRTEFYVQYRSSSSSSRSTVSSSSYFTADSYLTNGYRFTSSDYGSHTFSSFIKFNRNGYFRLYVRDDNSNSEYVEFNVNGSSYNTLNISANRTSPSTDQWVNVTVDTESSYRGRTEFYVQYRSSSSSSRSTVSSSSYFTADSYLTNGYRFTSSDYGSHTFSSFIKFNRNGYFRLYVRDDNSNSEYVEFNVNGSSYNTLNISTNRSAPSTDQWVNVTVNTESSYRGRTEFYVQYRSSSSSSWSTVSSSSYFTADSYLTNGYRFTSSDYGSHTFSSFIKFNRNGYFRLYVRDDNSNSEYVEFNVNGSSYNTLNISTNRSAPSTDQWVNVTVNTESSYRGRTEFYVQYRSSSSSSWSTVSSSSYFTADSYLTNGYHFTSSDYGSHTFSSFIKFNRNGYFRLYVRDDNSNSEYVEFNVNGSSYNTLNISTNRSTPSTNQWVNITIETDSSYRDYVYFSLEYRDGSTRRSASTSYYEADNYFNRGYLFSSSDRGYITLNSFIRFNRTYLYRLYVEDRNGNSRYVEFDVGGNNGGGSNVDGFSTIELRKITNVSNIRNSVIAELKRNSYSLRNDSYWQRLSDTLYTNMRDVVNNRNSRTFAYYSDFLSAFNERYKYTARNA